jgi:putative NADPH-quinone reductase
MRVLVVYAHPLSDSFAAALRDTVVQRLHAAGHEVDHCDLYAESFDPVLTAAERRAYNTQHPDLSAVDAHVARLRAAEALVLCFPTWWYGMPAILKGWFDRVWTNEIAYRLVEGARRPTPLLGNIRRLVVVTTHGSSKWINAVEGEGGKRVVNRSLRAMCNRWTRTKWIALYDADRATETERQRFLRRVAHARILR